MFADPDSHFFKAESGSLLEGKDRSGSALKAEFWSFKGLKWGHRGRGRSQWWRVCSVGTEPWRVCRPVVADSHHFDE